MHRSGSETHRHSHVLHTAYDTGVLESARRARGVAAPAMPENVVPLHKAG
ncbi:hypothetical protein [Pelomicrobium sp. G1]